MTDQHQNEDFLPSPSVVKEIYKKSKIQKKITSIVNLDAKVKQDNNEAIQLTKKFFSEAIKQRGSIIINNSISKHTIELLENLGYFFNDYEEVERRRKDEVEYFEEKIKDLRADFSREALAFRKFLYTRIKDILTDTRTFEEYTNSVLPKIFQQIDVNINHTHKWGDHIQKVLAIWAHLETHVTINEITRQTQLKDLLIDEFLFEWSQTRITFSSKDIELINQKSLAMIEILNSIKNTKVKAAIAEEELDQLLKTMLKSDLQVIWEFGDCDFEGTPPDGLFQAFILKWISTPGGQKSLSELKHHIEEEAANQRTITTVKFDWIVESLPINDEYVTNDFCNLARFLGFNAKAIGKDVSISWE